MLQKSQIENKIPDITNLATKAAQNTKATEVVSKILDRANLATTVVKTKAQEIERKTSNTKVFNTTPKLTIFTKINFEQNWKKERK